MQDKGTFNTDYEPSEGEQFIANYFEEHFIKYKTEEKINNLHNDNKSYRVADFYLPKYDIYVEFFGQWNSNKENRERYREKKGVYYKNNIPCIYLYPENLGILDYSFHTRIVNELKKHGKKRELFKYRINRFTQEPRNNDILLLFLFILFLLIIASPDNQYYPLYIIAQLFVTFNLLGRILKAFDIRLFRSMNKTKIHKKKLHRP